MTAAIELEDVSVSFDGGRRFAVRALDLVVPRGQFVALVGGSGSGKTTTLKCVNRLVEPTAGLVRVEGEDVRSLAAPLLRRRIGYVFQGIGLFPHLTVAENIAVGPRLVGWSAMRIDARVAELLDLVGLEADLAGRTPAALSGGQQQRVGVARALAAGPGVMLMDEPFGALDPVTRESLGRACRKLHDRLGLTTLMVTHDMAEAIVLADRIVVLDGGRIVADGTPSRLFKADLPEAAQALLAAPRRQAEAVARALSPEGRPSNG